MDKNPIFLSHSHRKSIDTKRRDQMRALYCNLSSLLPNQPPKDDMSLSDQLREAANYINNLQERLETMKKRKKNLSLVTKSAHFNSVLSSDVDSAAGEVNQPRIEIHSNSSTLGVVLITGFEQHHRMLKETVRTLHEEGADVVCAGFSVKDQTAFHTVCSEIGGSGLECEAARICERLGSLVSDDD